MSAKYGGKYVENVIKKKKLMRRTTIRSALPFSIMKNNKIKLPKFKSLIVSEVRNLDGIFLCSHEFGNSRSSCDFR